MKLADSNVWLALAIERHVFHEAAQDWMATQTAAGAVLFCRATQQSFLRLLTTAAVLQPYGSPPLSNQEAWALYEATSADARVEWSDEPPDLASQWQAWSTRDTASPKLWMDAYLAAFAMAGGHQLVTTDKGFEQFTGLDVQVISA